MARGPRSLNVVSLLLLLGVAALSYAVWKFFPVYFMAWQVDHALAEGGARAYKISRAPEPGKTREKEALIADLRQKVVDLGVRDPEMALTLEFVGMDYVDVRCAYRAIVIHPLVDRYTVLTMQRSARTSLEKPKWEQ